jgi:hypothetical protein
VITYKAKLKSRKIMAEIPREQQGWWADVAGGQTLILRDAYEDDLARCFINEGQSRDPDDYLCEDFDRGCLVKRIAIAKLDVVKNCYSCDHIEYNGCTDPGEIGGWNCAKRDPKTVEEERQFDKNWADEAYRNRYKRCYERVAQQSKGDGHV